MFLHRLVLLLCLALCARISGELLVKEVGFINTSWKPQYFKIVGSHLLQHDSKTEVSFQIQLYSAESVN